MGFFPGAWEREEIQHYPTHPACMQAGTVFFQSLSKDELAKTSSVQFPAKPLLIWHTVYTYVQALLLDEINRPLIFGLRSRRRANSTGFFWKFRSQASTVNFADKSLKVPLSPPPETLELKEWQTSDYDTRSENQANTDPRFRKPTPHHPITFKNKQRLNKAFLTLSQAMESFMSEAKIATQAMKKFFVLRMKSSKSTFPSPL
ncbi:hypothetical protein ACTXT7_006573 [Hymenolepis weldensis]